MQKFETTQPVTKLFIYLQNVLSTLLKKTLLFHELNIFLLLLPLALLSRRRGVGYQQPVTCNFIKNSKDHFTRLKINAHPGVFAQMNDAFIRDNNTAASIKWMELATTNYPEEGYLWILSGIINIHPAINRRHDV